MRRIRVNVNSCILKSNTTVIVIMNNVSKLSNSWESVEYVTTKNASQGKHVQHTSMCEATDYSVYVHRLLLHSVFLLCVSGVTSPAAGREC